MPKHHHHFVPTFYLRAFGYSDKQIALFNIGRELFVPHASLRDQCYQYNFHGPTERIENWLATLEDQIAPAIASIRTEHCLPEIASEAWACLIAFTGLQLLRTRVAAKRIIASSDKMFDVVFRGDESSRDEWDVGLDYPVLSSLKPLPDVVLGLSDLKAQLIVAPSGSAFVTSDNPVYRYNQYCEGAWWSGVTGALCRGLQLFVPLAPESLLLLYDGCVYKVGDKRSNKTVAQPSDVEALNLLQVVGADENLYFQDPMMHAYVRKLVLRGRGMRDADHTQVGEYPELGHEQTSSLVHLYDRMPNLHSCLSFVSIRRARRRVALFERSHMLRKRMFSDADLPEDEGERRTFVRHDRA